MKILKTHEKIENKKRKRKRKTKLKPIIFWLSLTVVPMEPQVEAWQNLKRPSKIGQSSLTLMHLSCYKKVGLMRISNMVEPVIARWGRSTVVAVVAQGKILGGEEYVFGKKIGGNLKINQGELT